MQARFGKVAVVIHTVHYNSKVYRISAAIIISRFAGARFISVVTRVVFHSNMPARGVKKTTVRKRSHALHSNIPARGVKNTIVRKRSHARLTPASRNRIIGMKLAGAARKEMCDKVRKTDGWDSCGQGGQDGQGGQGSQGGHGITER